MPLAGFVRFVWDVRGGGAEVAKALAVCVQLMEKRGEEGALSLRWVAEAGGCADTAKLLWRSWLLLARVASMARSRVGTSGGVGTGECGGIETAVQGGELMAGLPAQGARFVYAFGASLMPAD